MKALGLPPTDPRLARMSDVQWDWCYWQVITDVQEETLVHRRELSLLVGSNNPAMGLEMMRVTDATDPSLRRPGEDTRAEARRRVREIRASGGTAGVDEETAELLRARREQGSVVNPSGAPAGDFVEDEDG